MINDGFVCVFSAKALLPAMHPNFAADAFGKLILMEVLALSSLLYLAIETSKFERESLPVADATSVMMSGFQGEGDVAEDEFPLPYGHRDR